MNEFTSQSFKLEHRDPALHPGDSSHAIRLAVQSGPVPHISFESGNPANGGVSYLLWDKLLAALVENIGPLLWPFLPTNVPSRYLGVHSPGSYIPYTQLQRPNHDFECPPVIGAHPQRTELFVTHILPQL
jgi:hypothetical protein